MSERNLRIWISLGLAGAVLLLYGQVLHHEFVSIDDRQYVYGNPNVTRGITWEGVAWAFTTSHEGNWHPLTWLSHMLDVELFGLAPGAHHMTSVVLHAANAVLLFLAFLLLTRETWPSAFVAVLFALHPLRVESVAWVAERKDVLSGFFFMLTLVAYARYARRPSRGTFAPVVALLALGLMAKPMLVTLPLVLLLLDVWPLGRWQGLRLRARAVSGPEPQPQTLARLLVEKSPLLALAAFSSVIAAVSQARGGAVMSYQKIDLVVRLANALVSLVTYLWQTVWPTHLAVMYPHPALLGRAASLSLPAVGAGLALAGIICGAWVVRRRRPYLPMGWLWYLGMLMPVIGLFQVGIQARADRYTYLPLIGVYTMVAWGLRDLGNQRVRLRLPLRLAAAAVLGSLAAVTWVQVGTWRDNEKLYRHALAVTTSNYLVHNNLAAALSERGKTDEAVQEYRRSISAKPNFSHAHFNLGALLAKLGDLDGARREYEEALRFRPDFLEAHNNLAVILTAQGDSAGAAEHYEAILRIQPDFASNLYSRGALLLNQGELAGARAQFEEALRVDSNDFWSWYNLGVIAAKEGRLPQATEFFARAVQIAPEDAQAHNALATVLARQRRYGEAEGHFEEAVRLAPDFAAAREGLEKVRRILGKSP